VLGAVLVDELPFDDPLVPTAIPTATPTVATVPPITPAVVTPAVLVVVATTGVAGGAGGGVGGVCAIARADAKASAKADAKPINPCRIPRPLAVSRMPQQPRSTMDSIGQTIVQLPHEYFANTGCAHRTGGRASRAVLTGAANPGDGVAQRRRPMVRRMRKCITVAGADQDRTASRAPSRFDVAPAVADHDAAGEIDAELLAGGKNESRFRLSTIAAIIVVVIAHSHVIEPERAGERAVGLLDKFPRCPSPPHVRLIRHHDEKESRARQFGAGFLDAIAQRDPVGGSDGNRLAVGNVRSDQHTVTVQKHRTSARHRQTSKDGREVAA
jgi:hypothetical protein